MIKKTLIVLVGPTAIGKTALSINIAKNLNTDIISADSRQFFKEMNIGTAKPTAEELKQVPHHLVGHISINEAYNVGKFEAQALDTLNKIFTQKNTCLLTGGSGLYINAVCHGFDHLPEIDPSIREELNNINQKSGIETLQKKLKELDPSYYDTVDLNNPQRIIRALEVCLSADKPFSSFRTGKTNIRNFDILKIGLDMERSKLYERINLRVDEMIKLGLVQEVNTLIPFKKNNALQTVGYKELFDCFDGKTTMENAIDMIKQNTRRYAKRQLTWFRKDKEINWFNPNQEQEIISFLKQQIDA
jgi:tRNA dimethylallyltransferase